VGRRRLTTAIPALEGLCRRFKGFGLEHAVPEQVAALSGLTAIGTPEAAAAVSRIIADSVAQGPGLRDAVDAAVHLGCRLPPAISVVLLRHNDAQVRAAACRCARPDPDVMPLLVDLLDDLHGPVAVAAACALGRTGRTEARPMLARLLRDEPTEEVIDAVSSVADEYCIVQLGRIARINPALSTAAIDALDLVDHPRAQVVIAAVRGTV
jgi:HEAT repeat protein